MKQELSNKLVLSEDVNNNYVFTSENESVIVAEFSECTTDTPDEAWRARRIVECYNLFAGIENPTEYFNSLIESINK